MSATTFVLWGRMADGTPIKIEAGTLAQVRRELDYRKRLIATGGFTDLRIRPQGHPYDACACDTCRTESDTRAALAQLDGTPAAAVSMLTGLSADALSDLGGVDQ